MNRPPFEGGPKSRSDFGVGQTGIAARVPHAPRPKICCADFDPPSRGGSSRYRSARSSDLPIVRRMQSRRPECDSAGRRASLHPSRKRPKNSDSGVRRPWFSRRMQGCTPIVRQPCSGAGATGLLHLAFRGLLLLSPDFSSTSVNLDLPMRIRTISPSADQRRVDLRAAPTRTGRH
jgi:hypothetical protein